MCIGGTKMIMITTITAVIVIMITELQQNMLRWCGHVSRKNQNDYAKECTDYKVEHVLLELDQEILDRELVEKLSDPITK